MTLQKWKIIDSENSYEKPSARFGHSMDLVKLPIEKQEGSPTKAVRTKDYLIIFGGGGAYNKSAKMRVCNKEFHTFDLSSHTWIQDFILPSETGLSPDQRMYHAS